MAIVHHASMIIFIRQSGQVQAGVMKSVVIKRSILLNGRKTSISLENEFWDALNEIAARANVKLSKVLEKIDQDRTNINLSSAVRVFVFSYFRALSEKGSSSETNSHFIDDKGLRARAEECRALAEGFKNAAIRSIMLRVAADCDVLAERMERTSVKEPEEYL